MDGQPEYGCPICRERLLSTEAGFRTLSHHLLQTLDIFKSECLEKTVANIAAGVELKQMTSDNASILNKMSYRLQTYSLERVLEEYHAINLDRMIYVQKEDSIFGSYQPNIDILPFLIISEDGKYYELNIEKINKMTSASKALAKSLVKQALTQYGQIAFDPYKILASSAQTFLHQIKCLNRIDRSSSFLYQLIHKLINLWGLNDDKYPVFVRLGRDQSRLIAHRFTSLPYQAPIIFQELLHLFNLTLFQDLDFELVKLRVDSMFNSARDYSYLNSELQKKSLFVKYGINVFSFRYKTAPRDYQILTSSDNSGETIYVGCDDPERNWIESYLDDSYTSSLKESTSIEYKMYNRFQELYTGNVMKDLTTISNNSYALTPSVFFVRDTTIIVLKEYSSLNAPPIEKPLNLHNALYVEGVVPLFFAEPGTFEYYLYMKYAKMTEKLYVSFDYKLQDYPQLVKFSSMINRRGGSTKQSLRKLEEDGLSYAIHKPEGVYENQSKIFFAAVIDFAEKQITDSLMTAQISTGTRYQVMRRPRTIMPVNVFQQRAGLMYAIVADAINDEYGITASKQHLQHKTKNRIANLSQRNKYHQINIDLKACDASIRWEKLLRLTNGGMMYGARNFNAEKTLWGCGSRESYLCDEQQKVKIEYKLNAMQHLVLQLSNMFKDGLNYDAYDPFMWNLDDYNNRFSYRTSTYPTGISSTSAGHTAMNSIMMDYFLYHHLPKKFPHFAKRVQQMSFREIYICQGDDGLLGLPKRLFSRDDVKLILDELIRFGKDNGISYDIDANGTAEFLKVFYWDTIQLHHLGRHSLVSREVSIWERAPPYPYRCDLLLQSYQDAIGDGHDFATILYYYWCMAGFYNTIGKSNFSEKNVKIMSNVRWSRMCFIYGGLPPLQDDILGDYAFSMYFPQGDLGMLTYMQEIFRRLCPIKSDDERDKIYQIIQYVYDNNIIGSLGNIMFANARQRNIAPRTSEANSESTRGKAITKGEIVMKQMLRQNLIAGTILKNVYKGLEGREKLRSEHPDLAHKLTPRGSLYDLLDYWINELRDSDQTNKNELLSYYQLFSEKPSELPNHLQGMMNLLLIPEIKSKSTRLIHSLHLTYNAHSISDMNMVSSLNRQKALIDSMIGPATMTYNEFLKKESIQLPEFPSGTDTNSIKKQIYSLLLSAGSTDQKLISDAIRYFLMSYGVDEMRANESASKYLQRNLQRHWITEGSLLDLNLPSLWFDYDLDFLWKFVNWEGFNLIANDLPSGISLLVIKMLGVSCELSRWGVPLFVRTVAGGSFSSIGDRVLSTFRA